MASASKKSGSGAKTPADRLTQAGVKVWRVYQTILMDPADLTLVRDPKHPLFDPRVNDPVDPDSPRYQEILAAGSPHTAIKARENGEKNGKPTVQVVDGRDRTQILQHINKHHPLEAGPRKLKVDLVHGDDGEMVLLSLSANGHKAETPYSMAVKIGKAQKYGQALEEIAKACGWKTVSHVQTHLAILNFIPEVQQAFHGPEALPLTSVPAFAKVPREEQAAALAKVRGGGAKKVREVTAAVEAAQNGHEYVPPTPRKKMWGGPDRLAKLSAAVLEQVGNGWEEVPAPHLQALTAHKLLRFLLGDADALADQPLLQAAVAQVAATL
jgi:ParB family chromosome partitioning protein